MTPSAWVEDARRLLADGMSVREISRTLGVSRSTIRTRLNINGANDRLIAQNAERKVRAAAGEFWFSKKKLPPRDYTAPPAVAKVSVPFVAILSGHVSPSYEMVRL